MASQLSILPIYDKIIKIDIFAITGSSGGGKIPSLKNHHSTRSKDLFSYNINNHRHLGEIFQSFPNLNKNNLSFIRDILFLAYIYLFPILVSYCGVFSIM